MGSDEYLARLGFDTSSADKAVQQTVTLLGHLGNQFDTVSGKAQKAERALLGTGTASATAGQQIKTTASATTSLSDSAMPRLRYALYDVAVTYGILSAALLGFSALAVKTGADFESAFTNVQRTSNDSAEGVDELRDSLVDLSTELPKTFDELSQIAALGNQLGIDPANIESFTRVIAEFSSVTGIAVDQVAEAFGKISNLTGLDPSQYENLASAIAFVARNSAATEATIIATTKEIAAAGTSAGLSAAEIVGLAGALSSLAIPPERARGALQTYFGALNKAVAEGGSDLSNFALLVGVSADELERMVRNGQGADVLQGFLASLGQLDSVSKTQALEELGLSAIRTDQAFRALSQSGPLVAQSLANAEGSMADGTELARQYALVVDDLNSQWMIFVNSINALVEEVSGNAVPGLAGLLSILTQIVNGFRAFAASDVGGAFLRFGLVIAFITGLFFAYQAVTALATASTYALITAQAGLAASGTVGGIRGLITAMLGLRTASGAAVGGLSATTVAATVMGGASARAAALVARLRNNLFKLGRATLVLAAIQGIIELIFNFGESMQTLVGIAAGVIPIVQAINRAVGQFLIDVGSALGFFGEGLVAAGNAAITVAAQLGVGLKVAQRWANGLTKGNSGVSSSFYSASTAAGDFSGALDGVGSSAGGAGKQVRTLADYASDLQEVIGRAFEIRFGPTQGLDAITSGWLGVADGLAKVNQELADYQAEMMRLTADRAVREYWLSVAEAYGDVLRAGELRADIADIDSKLAKTQGDLAKAQGKASKTLTGNSQAAIDNRAEILGLVKSYQAYLTSLASSGASQETLAAATAQLKADFLAQAVALGYSSAELGTYASAFDDVSVAIGGVPRNITVTANANPALQALNEFVAKAKAAIGSGISVPIRTDPVVQIPRLIIDGSDVHFYNQALDRGQINAAQYHKYLYGFRKGTAWTGSGNPNEIAGFVHNQEAVLNQRGTQTVGSQFVNAANQGRNPWQYAPQESGGGGIPGVMIVEPGPQMIEQFQAIARKEAIAILASTPEQLAGYVARGNASSQYQGKR